MELGTSVYLDTNFFVYLTIEEVEEVRGITAALKNINVYTSALSYDEFVWVIRKQLGKEASYKSAHFFLALDFLRIIAVDRHILDMSKEIMVKEHLKPRDSIHLASALHHNIGTIITEDTDFDHIEGTQRLSTEQFLKQLK